MMLTAPLRLLCHGILPKEAPFLGEAKAPTKIFGETKRAMEILGHPKMGEFSIATYMIIYIYYIMIVYIINVLVDWRLSNLLLL